MFQGLVLTKHRRHVSTLATLSVELGSFPANAAAAAGAALGGGEEGAVEVGDTDGRSWEIAVGEDGFVCRTHALSPPLHLSLSDPPSPKK